MRNHYSYLRKGIIRMMKVYECDLPEHRLPKRGLWYKFNDYYKTLLADFSASVKFHPNTLGDIVWVSRKFFSWLYENGHPDLTRVEADEIQTFVMSVACAFA